MRLTHQQGNVSHPSMYGIYTNIHLVDIYGKGKYTIHGSYGYATNTVHPVFWKDFEISTINTHKKLSEINKATSCKRVPEKRFISVSYIYIYIHINIRSVIVFPTHVGIGIDSSPFPKTKSWKPMRPRWPCIRIRRNVPGKRDLSPKKTRLTGWKGYPSGQKHWRLDLGKMKLYKFYPPFQIDQVGLSVAHPHFEGNKTGRWWYKSIQWNKKPWQIPGWKNSSPRVSWYPPWSWDDLKQMEVLQGSWWGHNSKRTCKFLVDNSK